MASAPARYEGYISESENLHTDPEPATDPDTTASTGDSKSMCLMAKLEGQLAPSVTLIRESQSNERNIGGLCQTDDVR
jgi:hypothetical protein